MSKSNKNSNQATSNKNVGKKQTQKVDKEKTPKGKETLPLYYQFTRKAVEFAMLARSLSEVLVQVYGPGTTISAFERLVAEYPSYKDEVKNLVYLDETVLRLLRRYRDAKTAKDSERKSFRSDVGIKDIETGLETCLSSLAPPLKKKESSDDEGLKESEVGEAKTGKTDKKLPLQ